MQPFSIWPDTPEKLDKARARFDRFDHFSARYKRDASLRARLDGGDTADSLATLGIDIPDGIEAKIVADTPEVLHLIMPPDPNIGLSDEMLDTIAGGKSVSSAATGGSVGSVGTACTTGSTVSSAGSVGSAGTVS